MYFAQFNTQNLKTKKKSYPIRLQGYLIITISGSNQSMYKIYCREITTFGWTWPNIPSQDLPDMFLDHLKGIVKYSSD